jgi:pimeloyl-ACP methyl ester carboxylesterase
MVIVHGAGSQKENHGDFGRACAAGGWAAIAYDQRGHGASEDGMAPEALDDVAAIARLLAATDGVDRGRVCARGSSLGGFMAIHAAARADEVAAAIAICPAHEASLLRGLRRETLEMRLGPEGTAPLEEWLERLDIGDAVERMGAKPLLLIHAEGDEQIPWQSSRELYERAADARRLIVLPGGHHRSAQHDAEINGVALRWMERELGSSG